MKSLGWAIKRFKEEDLKTIRYDSTSRQSHDNREPSEASWLILYKNRFFFPPISPLFVLLIRTSAFKSTYNVNS